MVSKTWGCNVYVIEGDNPLMIDAGFPLDANRIEREVTGTAFKRDRTGTVVATHYHLDHVGSIAKLKRTFGLKVAAHSADALVIEGKEPYLQFKVDALRLAYYTALKPLYRYTNVDVGIKLAEGNVMEVLGGLRVIHVPGHTPGSIVLYSEARGVLFSGDTIRNENGLLDGPPPIFTPGIEEAYWSIRNKLLKLDFDTLMPGHGMPVVIGAKARLTQMLGEQGRLE